MNKITNKIILALLMISLVIFLQGSRLTRAEKNLSFQKVLLNQQDRILILAPHPDDEALGNAGVIQKALALKLPLKIVFFTYGDNNQWSFLVYRKHPVILPKAVQAMGLVRHDEAVEAGKTLGVLPENLIFLGYPDFRTLNIWYSHWGNSSPAKGMLTEVEAVPYKDAFRPGAPYKGEEILGDLKAIIREFRPTKIFVSHPADHNPDHRSLYLFLRIALWDLGEEITPIVYPYLIHYKQWPKPRGFYPKEKLIPPQFFEKMISWHEHYLSSEEIDIKHNATKKHRSQYNSSATYLLSFIRSNELFGDFPIITLRPNIDSILLISRCKGDLVEFSEQLTDEERASFIGFEERFVRIEDNQFVFSIKLSRPVTGTVGVSVYIFGYRKDRAFQDMPKLHIKFGAIEHKVFNQNILLHVDVAKVERKPKEITIRVPLELLGDPQRILNSANTYLGIVPLDWVAWRILEIAD